MGFVGIGGATARWVVGMGGGVTFLLTVEFAFRASGAGGNLAAEGGGGGVAATFAVRSAMAARVLLGFATSGAGGGVPTAVPLVSAPDLDPWALRMISQSFWF